MSLSDTLLRNAPNRRVPKGDAPLETPAALPSGLASTTRWELAMQTTARLLHTFPAGNGRQRQTYLETGKAKQFSDLGPYVDRPAPNNCTAPIPDRPSRQENGAAADNKIDCNGAGPATLTTWSMASPVVPVRSMARCVRPAASRSVLVLTHNRGKATWRLRSASRDRKRER